MPEKKAIFKLENVTKIFDGKDSIVKALDDVSLEVFEGEIFGIIGMSGAGKSTLVRTLNRLESITDGTILFDNQDLALLSPKKLRSTRQQIGMIFQDFNLLTQRKVLDNIMLPMKIAGVRSASERRSRAREMLNIVGISEKENAYPAQLSGGQKQRVAIARAISVAPKVLLCDEATSALDPKTTGEILSLLRDINEKTKITIIIITHEMEVIEKICNRVAIMNEGKLVEIGNVREIFTNPKTDTAKQLVYRKDNKINPFEMTDKRCVRVVFDGSSASEPIIADLVLTTGEKVSILSANTKSVGGIGFGQMILELPGKHEAAERVMTYLKQKGIFAAEIEGGESYL